jgi:uncharacterized membrane protein YhaH (DUF805 family)
VNTVDFGYLYGSTEGRIGRQSYWMGVVGFIVAGLIVYLIVNALSGVLTPTGRIVLFIIQLLFVYPSYALAAKRFQDRGKPPSYALLAIGLGVLINLLDLLGLTRSEVLAQPNLLGWILNIVLLIVAVWFLIELGFLKGTDGPNEYGPDPLQAPR